MIKVIIFDFDGVIVESTEIKTNAFVEVFKKEGKEAAEAVLDYHLKNAGVSRFDKFVYIYSQILKKPLSEEEFKRLCEEYAKLVVDNVVGAPYVLGAHEFLKKYASKYKYYCISATPQEEIEEITKRRSLDKFFSGIIGAPEKKPAAVKSILLKEKIIGNEALYIGDALADYLAATENAVNFIARIKNNEEIFSGVDCMRINDLVNLEERIQKLCPR